MTTNEVSQQSMLLCTDLVEKYRPVYGDAWAARGAPNIIAQIREACATKDMGRLLRLRSPFHLAVFTRITGIEVTQESARHRFEVYVGAEGIAAYERVQQQRDWKRMHHALFRRAAGIRVQTDYYGNLSLPAFLRRLLNEGYTTLLELTRRQDYVLCNAEGVGYLLRGQTEVDVALALLEEQSTENHPPTPAIITRRPFPVGRMAVTEETLAHLPAFVATALLGSVTGDPCQRWEVRSAWREVGAGESMLPVAPTSTYDIWLQGAQGWLHYNGQGRCKLLAVPVEMQEQPWLDVFAWIIEQRATAHGHLIVSAITALRCESAVAGLGLSHHRRCRCAIVRQAQSR